MYSTQAASMPYCWYVTINKSWYYWLLLLFNVGGTWRCSLADRAGWCRRESHGIISRYRSTTTGLTASLELASCSHNAVELIKYVDCLVWLRAETCVLGVLGGLYRFPVAQAERAQCRFRLWHVRILFLSARFWVRWDGMAPPPPFPGPTPPFHCYSVKPYPPLQPFPLPAPFPPFTSSSLFIL